MGEGAADVVQCTYMYMYMCLTRRCKGTTSTPEDSYSFTEKQNELPQVGRNCVYMHERNGQCVPLYAKWMLALFDFNKILDVLQVCVCVCVCNM